ncbi:hypothetical protein RRG08_033390 [Elysia crispata]|uniref:Uncharacterized protein n=1 Tax=Elysia crispata TaxID=231223 RepID=A0AAE0YYB0_9GAST|nr:hypothetical protein RRG08_033390 [Elysia crispata]
MGQVAAHTGSPGWLMRTGSSSHRLNRLVDDDRQQLTQAHQAGWWGQVAAHTGSPGWLMRTGSSSHRLTRLVAAHTGSPGWLMGTGSSSHRLTRLVDGDRQQLTQAHQAG